MSRGLQLAEVVPWGRSYDEYVRMFDLTAADLAGRLLGCADGPASFNATHSGRGGFVVSADPLYACRPEAIRRRIDETADTLTAAVAEHLDTYVWTDIPDPDALRARRLQAMNAFLADFAAADRAGRYLAAGLPKLPLADDCFDLALCSHYLFTYSATLSEAAHIAAARELLRVAAEVRIFPLVDTGATPSPHVEPVRAALAAGGVTTEIRRVPYEFQVGGDRMLVIRRGGAGRGRP